MDGKKLREIVGKNIYRIRTERKVLQAELGACCNRKEGVSAKNYISLLERGSRDIDIKLHHFLQICEFLDISPADLLAGIEYKGSPSITEFCRDKDEIELLKAYRELNVTGKDKTKQYVSDLDSEKFKDK